MDLDAAKTRLKKARMADARAAVSASTPTRTQSATLAVWPPPRCALSLFTGPEWRHSLSTCPLPWHHVSSERLATLDSCDFPLSHEALRDVSPSLFLNRVLAVTLTFNVVIPSQLHFGEAGKPVNFFPPLGEPGVSVSCRLSLLRSPCDAECVSGERKKWTDVISPFSNPREGIK